MSTNGTHNLYQRLNLISAEVSKIKPTGKTAPHQGSQPAISIADVEDALRDLFVKHKVVSGYSFTNQPIVVGTKGNADVWQADLNVWLVNADTPEERIDCRAVDIGSSPSAAVSFALKRFFRALFHLAEDDDESPPRRETGSVPGSSVTRERQERERQGVVRGGGQAVSATATPTSTVTTPSLSDAKNRLIETAEGFYGKPWSQLGPTVRALAQGSVGKSYENCTDEDLDKIRREIEGLALSGQAKR